jgi:hypothetical protein
MDIRVMAWLNRECWYVEANRLWTFWGVDKRFFERMMEGEGGGGVRGMDGKKRIWSWRGKVCNARVGDGTVGLGSSWVK